MAQINVTVRWYGWRAQPSAKSPYLDWQSGGRRGGRSPPQNPPTLPRVARQNCQAKRADPEPCLSTIRCTYGVASRLALTPQPPLPERERGRRRPPAAKFPLSPCGRGARGEGVKVIPGRLICKVLRLSPDRRLQPGYRAYPYANDYARCALLRFSLSDAFQHKTTTGGVMPVPAGSVNC